MEFLKILIILNLINLLTYFKKLGNIKFYNY